MKPKDKRPLTAGEKQKARRDLDRRLEEAGREMAEENLREAREWEPAEAEVNRML